MVTADTVVFEGPVNLTDRQAVAELRAVLDRHGYTATGVTDALGAALPFNKSHLRDDLPLYLRRLTVPTPINTLVKLFVLDRWVDQADAAAALAPLDLDRVRAMGLLEDGPSGVRARLRLSVHEGLLIAHDAYDEETRTLRTDHVLDVNPTTISLSHLTVRRPVQRALEIGTGCGVLALKASRHAEQVVATDTNPRALNLAVFNAALNGITNVEWRLGSLFEAVAGERFDLIFSNPPYVISPDSQFIFRDGGRRGDALCEEIIRRAPAHLRDGGYATVLINWAIRSNEEWSAPLRRWVDGNGCDSWLMLSAAEDPTTYAAMWTRSRDRATYSAGLERWIRYFDELGLHAIGLGAVVMRRNTSGTPWVRADQLPESVTAAASAHLERLFDAEDRLASLTDDAVLFAQRFETVRDHQLTQTLKFQGPTYTIASAEVRLQGGLPFNGTVDAHTTQLLARCDGRRTLAEIAAEIAATSDLDPDKCTSACATIARRLIGMGFLVPPSVTPAIGSSPGRQEGSVQ
ncbi:MAG: methyltransferase [Vicinamibacterales bacterium]